MAAAGAGVYHARTRAGGSLLSGDKSSLSFLWLFAILVPLVALVILLGSYSYLALLIVGAVGAAVFLYQSLRRPRPEDKR